MSVVDVYNISREKISELNLNDEVFGVEIKPHVLHQVVVSQMAARRSGTAATKTRSMVICSGKKLYKQKGTGRARAGGANSPTRRGGGIAFGPQPRSYAISIPKKVRKSALRIALTDKLRNNKLVVVDQFDIPERKTKKFAEILKRFEISKALIVTDIHRDNLDLASRNIAGIKVMRSEGINVYDLLKYDSVMLEQPAIVRIQEALVP
ncbi:MAG: 50S ribosomal protein L4 [Deltaproteobacteria bacterium CG_4_8_14_3_um_filter_51_11]|nr:50S ribosomal protein L4 [bacterium]OIP39414.1 MAG: 50S ribosomal protein L4 [Desulfobacteraceae bacterium CG2_30_51_40]PIP45293.1 MAG: 50S ribosomal protein L4 [Deltaproteobacteria bacterium CG23_combo_of_CG06-09_8_20_14_all_51_20]PIW02148.1 MAG: 50S ribosomal protein L4 [Deltaproteobacteria bacterium CG17_big_fil_post_rev_8_21_14_2_50_51_6]PIX21043.1 MAG: 50S ribosomal protein L4 [Deltaproteobacteria bacterium CG_4_8_14_3_um_filter_51_11]PIY22926.1 MAG: 50S ribosomal protein L4 [Deltaprot